MDDKEALLVVRLVEVLLWVDLEDVVGHLESDWLHLRGYFFAGLLNVAEGLVRLTIQFWQGSGPLLSNVLKDTWWNGKLRRAGVYDCWEQGALSWLLHALVSIHHALSLESPSA